MYHMSNFVGILSTLYGKKSLSSEPALLKLGVIDRKLIIAYI
jgi:hypothetical protein